MTPQQRLTDALRLSGFTFVQAAYMKDLLVSKGSLDDWPAFSASWNDLGPDTYMADGGRYRRRCHAAYAVNAGSITRQPAQPHYQSRDYNSLNGGIERWFEPVTDTIGAGATMTTVLTFCRSLFASLLPAHTWHVEIHQFRIEARSGEVGRPTPEGIHRDGVDYVLVLLVNRVNIESGITTVHNHGGDALGKFTLTHAFDAALVDDARVLHGVTPVAPIDIAKPGYRDVLVVTFKRSPESADAPNMSLSPA
jgi:hypothetical protein